MTRRCIGNTERRQRILDVLACGPATVLQLVQLTSLNETMLRDLLYYLNADGMAERVDGVSPNGKQTKLWRATSGAGAPSANASKRRVRPCMCCAKSFMSEGAHNRLCNLCRSASLSPYALAL